MRPTEAEVLKMAMGKVLDDETYTRVIEKADEIRSKH